MKLKYLPTLLSLSILFQAISCTKQNDNSNSQSAINASNQFLNKSTSTIVDSVTVDVSEFYNNANHVAGGFLHALTEDRKPADSLVKPLRIHTIRANRYNTFRQVDRTQELGIKQQLVVSDYWGGYAWQDPNKIPGKDGDWTEWENFVASNVTQSINRGISHVLQFDIWNEADGSGFWPYTGIYAYPDHFYETWKHAYQKIRSMVPDAIIVGPSYSNNGGNKVQAFLDYAVANDIVPNFVSWHFPGNIVQEVNDMRSYFVSKNIQPGIHINEYTLPSEEYCGKTAWLIAQLERAKVDAAMHAIWGSVAYGQLDGIITPAPAYEKKGTWWVYASYANITGNIVKTTPGSYVELVAGKDTVKGLLNVLLGTQPALPTGVVKVKLINTGNYIGKTFHLKLTRIPDNNRGVVLNVETVMEQTITINSNELDIEIPWNNINDAYYINLD